jgi:hypothetical protein
MMQHAAPAARSLEQCLLSLTKDDLHRMRRTLGVRNASSLNKQELARALRDHIIQHFADCVGHLDLERYHVLQKVREANGVLAAQALYEDQIYDPIYFQDFGLLFYMPAEKVVYMPEEIKQQLSSIDQVWLRARLRRNSEWITLTRGFLYYYGTLSIRQLLSLIGEYTSQTPDFMEFRQIMQDFAVYDEGITISSYGFSHYMVDDPARIRHEHEIRPTVEFRRFTKEEIMQAGTEDFIERNAAYRDVMSFLRQHWLLDAEEADMIVEELVYDIQLGSSPGELIERLQSNIEPADMKQMQLLVDKLIRLMNETRQWVLKGHSPKELRMQMRGTPEPERDVSGAEVFDFRTRKKVGRNDPCPCGSGKKFKKCCGR